MDILYKFLRAYLPGLSLRFYKEHPSQLDSLFAQHQKYLFELSRTYPSVINNGYRHIENAIYLLNKYKLDDDYHIIDVGGASGLVAKMFAVNFPGSIIHSFEPIKHSFSLLSETLKALPNVKTYNFGLGNKEDNFFINVSNRVTSSSLFEINKQIDDPFFAENLKHNRVEEIYLKRIDDIFEESKNISLIKLDVQGFELEVLNGAIRALERTRFILTEVMNHDFYEGAPRYFELDSFLRDNNFELLDIIPSIRRNDKLMEWDVIYYNKGLLNI